jgi:hypothetical protein
LSTATASHAAGPELPQTAWAVHHWGNKDWDVFERYRLYNNYTPQLRVVRFSSPHLDLRRQGRSAGERARIHDEVKNSELGMKFIHKKMGTL